MEDFIKMSKTATSRQPEVTNTSSAKLTLQRYSSGLEPGDSSPVHISQKRLTNVYSHTIYLVVGHSVTLKQM